MLAAVFPRARTSLYQPPPQVQTEPPFTHIPAPAPHSARIIPFPAPSPTQAAPTARAPQPFLVIHKSISPPNVPSLVQILGPQTGLR
jgi:hypothetical protein